MGNTSNYAACLEDNTVPEQIIPASTGQSIGEFYLATGRQTSQVPWRCQVQCSPKVSLKASMDWLAARLGGQAARFGSKRWTPAKSRPLPYISTWLMAPGSGISFLPSPYSTALVPGQGASQLWAQSPGLHTLHNQRPYLPVQGNPGIMCTVSFQQQFHACWSLIRDEKANCSSR